MGDQQLYDGLTGLPSRKLFFDQLKEAPEPEGGPLVEVAASAILETRLAQLFGHVIAPVRLSVESTLVVADKRIYGGCGSLE